MPQNMDLLHQKRNRTKKLEENDDIHKSENNKEMIQLTINNKIKSFETFQNRLNKAESLFGYHNLNVPLIKGKERLRLILYRYRLTEKQISNVFEEIVKTLDDYMNKIQPDEKKFNILTYYIILNILKINSEKCSLWFNCYLNQIMDPNKQLLEYQTLKINKNIKIEISDLNQS